MFGIVAVDDRDQPIALANLRWFPEPSIAALGLFLEDLFTSPESRGNGAASSLLMESGRIAAERGAVVVRWITAADNRTARDLYDRLAIAGPWVTYDMKPGSALSE